MDPPYEFAAFDSLVPSVKDLQYMQDVTLMLTDRLSAEVASHELLLLALVLLLHAYAPM
jgi:hypothetical protein